MGTSGSRRNIFKKNKTDLVVLLFHILMEKITRGSFYLKEIQGSKCVVLTMIKLWETGPYVSDRNSHIS